MAKKKENPLYFCQWNCERFLSSSMVNELTISGVGMYTKLLMLAFLRGEEGLPASESRLRHLIGFHSEDEWLDNRELILSKFPVTGNPGRRFNEVMLSEFYRAKKAHQTAVENGGKGGRPPKTKNPQVTKIKPMGYENKTHRVENQNLTNTQHPTPIDPDKPTPTRARCDAPKSITEIGVDSSARFDSPEHQLAEMVGSESCESWGPVYRWAFQHEPTIARELTQLLADSLNPEARDTKGLSEVREPGKWFVAMLDDKCSEVGVTVPRLNQLRHQNVSSPPNSPHTASSRAG